MILIKRLVDENVHLVRENAQLRQAIDEKDHLLYMAADLGTTSKA